MRILYKCVILDRDGVINVKMPDSRYVLDPIELNFIPGSIEAMATISQKAKLAIATNQACISKGLLSHAELGIIHNKLLEQLTSFAGKIDLIKYCPHQDLDDCNCRKPRTGMLEQICKELDLEKSEVCFIGDSKVDFEAANSFGIDFYLVETGNGMKTKELVDCVSFPDLNTAIKEIL